MLFRRRSEETGWRRFRVAVWPRRSWHRSLAYFSKRVLRLSGTPHAIAFGVATGVFVSFFPYLGCHLVGAVAIAWLFGGNLIAAVLGTGVGNPVTFPFIWMATMETGRFVLGRGDYLGSGEGIGRRLMSFDFHAIWDPLLKPMTVGGLPLGLLAALVAYLVTRSSIGAFRIQRRRRLLERARQRARQHAETPRKNDAVTA